MRFRADLRARWAALLALTILVGLAGGAALTAFAGARRTATAYDRLVRETEAWDLLVNPDSGSESALDDRAVARLPQVAAAGRVDGLFVGPADFGSLGEFFDFAIVLVSDGRAGYRFARPRLEAGRMPRADRPDEALVSPVLARQRDLHVGDRLDLIGMSSDDVALLDRTEPTPEAFAQIEQGLRAGWFGTPASVTVTGIGTFPDDVVVDEGFENGQLFLPPAFGDRHAEIGIPFWGSVVRLRDPAVTAPAFRRGVQALVPDEPIAFQSQARVATKVERAVRPAVGALGTFALVVAVTGVLVVGQAIARQTVLDATDHDTLRALGSTRGSLFMAEMLRGVVIAVAGAVLAVVLAVVASPLTPIGVARNLEPDPGLHVDAAVLGLGFAAVLAVVLVLTAVPAWLHVRRRADDERAVRPSRVSALAADAGLSVPVAAGLRMALEPGRGRTAVPVRTTIVSAGLAIATVVAAVVFAASLDHLVSTPRLFGWNWDTQLSVEANAAQPGAGDAARDAVVELLASSPAVVRWGTVSLSDLTVDGAPMPAVGIDTRRSAALPTLVEGRLPAADDEIAFGRLTERQLGVGPGDVVTVDGVDGDRSRLKVVGTVVLPGLGTYPGSDKTSLGEGAVVTRATLYRLGPQFGRDDFVVRFDSKASVGARRAVVAKAGRIAEQVDPEGFTAAEVQRPSDIIAYDRVRSVPLVLALVLALLAFATLAHALVSAIRRRRRDFALLATLGLTRRQVSSTIAWQATTVGVCALLIGIPLGIIGGRWAWGLLADDLGTPSEPRVPVLAVLLGTLAVIVLCNLVAYVPGRIAARIRPAVVLRSE
jgi:hypothetical protein